MWRYLFYLFFIKPLVLFILGINVRGHEYLPNKGAAILVANHNSHIDTLALLSLFPLRLVKKIRPVAAADYFLTNGFLKWFALNVMGIIPIERHKKPDGSLFKAVLNALDNGDIVIVFPEGSRGEPEVLSKLKNGIAHLVSERPNIPVIPVFFHGLGKCLPRGEILLVPFFVDAFIGQPLYFEDSRAAFMQKLNDSMQELQKQVVSAD
ncbi:1-acyl-sn-glycerol-3-phosphate acyltransferase [Patescibacteria group bacterium]|nr:1-acyl-sn-glycerol-3-phosphate acyltransferase [Patescibacteria group bacterium]